MTRPDDIPEWAWSKADQLAGVGWGSQGQGIRETFVREIARALVAAERRGIEAERERCARVADDREAICADAVRKIEAGELYRDIPTARATEECARLEAAHIGRLIRQLGDAP